MDKPIKRWIEGLFSLFCIRLTFHRKVHFIFIAILVVVFSGCGSDKPAPPHAFSSGPAVSAPEPSAPSPPAVGVPQQPERVLTVYRFTATVDRGSLAGAGIQMEHGDLISGTFSYYTDSPLQAPPAGIEFTLNSFHFVSDINEFPQFVISVTNDDASIVPMRDQISICGGDPIAKTTLGALNVQTILSFRDLTAQAVNDESTPQSLDLVRFPSADIFINVTMPDVRYSGGLTYGLGATIVSLERVS